MISFRQIFRGNAAPSPEQTVESAIVPLVLSFDGPLLEKAKRPVYLKLGFDTAYKESIEKTVWGDSGITSIKASPLSQRSTDIASDLAWDILHWVNSRRTTLHNEQQAAQPISDPAIREDNVRAVIEGEFRSNTRNDWVAAEKNLNADLAERLTALPDPVRDNIFHPIAAALRKVPGDAAPVLNELLADEARANFEILKACVTAQALRPKPDAPISPAVIANLKQSYDSGLSLPSRPAE